jgi:GMP synthase-like glutamine amidotransferase
MMKQTERDAQDHNKDASSESGETGSTYISPGTSAWRKQTRATNADVYHIASDKVGNRPSSLLRHDSSEQCEITGFHCGLPELFLILGCYAA